MYSFLNSCIHVHVHVRTCIGGERAGKSGCVPAMNELVV